MAQIFQMDAQTWRFEDGFVRFFLLEGRDSAVMIDSGASCPDALDLAKTLTDKPILLLNTHGDGDHTSGTGKFTEIHMHALDYVSCGVKDRFPETTLVEVKDGDVIELGDRPLKIIHIPGHTHGSVAILDSKNRALYAGDSVQKGHIFMFGRTRDVQQFEKSLDKLIALGEEYDCIYASHDELLLSGDYAQKVKAAWQQVQKGEIPFEVTDLFGNKVKAYHTEAVGFYLK